MRIFAVDAALPTNRFERARSVVVRFCLAGFLAAIAAPLLSQPVGAQMGKPAVDVGKPLIRNVREWDQYTGRFEAVKSVELRARVSGYLNSIHFQDGQLVNKGDLLFVIDPRPFEAELAAARAQVASAQAELKLAEAELARGQELFRKRNTPKAEVDRRRSQRDVAAAGVLVAQANVRTAQLNLGFTRITAPFSGRISDRRVDIGNLIAGGSAGSTLLTTIVALDPIYFEFDVSERAFLKYVRLSRSGQRPGSRETANPVYIRLADEETWIRRGSMNFVDNVVGRETGTVRGRAVLPNPGQLLQPGLFGELRLLGSGDYEAVMVPDRAILSDQANKIVMVVDANNKVAIRPVGIGPVIDGLRVIRRGLSENDRVIVNGVQKVRAGMEVTVTEINVTPVPDGFDPSPVGLRNP